MPVKVVNNRCPQVAGAFSQAVIDGLLNVCASWGARYAVESMGSGPEPSAPGEPPNIQTGELAGSVRDVGNKVVAGTHGIFLEKGTRKMAPRPFLLRACLKVQGQAASIAARALGL